MKHKISIFVWIFLIVGLCCYFLWTQTDEAQIWKNEELYMNYLKNENTDGMLSFWHDNGIGWPASAPHPSSSMESRKAYLDGLFSQVEVISFKIKPEDIKIFGDVAVVHYLIDWITQDAEGNKEEMRTRIIHTWMQKEGKWKIIGGMSAEYTF